MSDRKPRLIFFGNERLATGVSTRVPVLRGLIDEGYEIAALVVGRSLDHKSRKVRELEVGTVAKEHSIPLIDPVELMDESNLKKYKADAGVLVAYGKLVPPEVINLFPHGIINIHPSLLPLHRGSTPIESVILEGKDKTGVSLMKLVEKLDAGPVYAQEEIKLEGNESKQQLVDQLGKLGRDMLIKHLPAILNGSLKPEEQEELKATYTRKITKDSGVIDLDKSAEDIAREVRAYSGWPRTRHIIATKEMIITQAHASDERGLRGTLLLTGKQLGLHLEDGTLMIDKLIPPGRKEMTGQAFLAGYRPL